MRKDPLLLPRSLLCALVVFLTGLSGSAGAQSYFAFPLPYGKIVREIRIRGLVQTPESTVIRLLESKVGEPYTEETEDHDRRYLDRLGLFAAVQADPVVVGDEVFLTLSIRELPNFVPFPKLTISDTNGTSGGMGVRMANLLGRTISLSGSFKLGGATHADVSLETPWRAPGEQSYGVQYNYRDRRDKDDAHRENSHELELRLGVNLHSDWMLSARGGYLSFGSDTPGITLSPANRDHTPFLGAMLEYDHLDSASVPRNGWRGIFDVTQSGGFLGGDGDFVTAQFDLRRYQSLAHRHGLVLFTFASLQSGRVGGDLPVYRDFHIGGTNTVRGWESGARQGKNSSSTRSSIATTCSTPGCSAYGSTASIMACSWRPSPTWEPRGARGGTSPGTCSRGVGWGSGSSSRSWMSSAWSSVSGRRARRSSPTCTSTKRLTIPANGSARTLPFGPRDRTGSGGEGERGGARPAQSAGARRRPNRRRPASG